MYNDFYKTRPNNEQEKQAMLDWYKLEKECDEANATVIKHMNKDHLNKTKSKQIDAAVRRWDKEMKSQVKRTKNAEPIRYARQRTWLM